MNPSINKAIDIFNSEDPVSAILENRDFFPFIDRYGQYRHSEWPAKVHSDAELRAAIRREFEG